MLAAKYKLKRGRNFEKVKKEGTLLKSENFAIAVVARGDQDASRFGFVVSKKISKQAVQRNRIERALNEAVRYELPYLKRGYDVVFLAKKAILRKSTDEIMREVKQFLKKVGLTQV